MRSTVLGDNAIHPYFPIQHASVRRIIASLTAKSEDKTSRPVRRTRYARAKIPLAPI